MPITPGCQPAPGDREHRRDCPELRRLRLGLLADQRLDRPALLVEPVELGGDGAASSGSSVVSRRTPRSDLPTRPPALIRGPKREAEVAAARRLQQPRGFGERGKADIAARRHHLQPLGDERAVEAASWATSATVPSATRSSRSISFGSGAAGEEAAAAKLAKQARRRAGRRCRPRRDGHAPHPHRSRRGGSG